MYIGSGIFLLVVGAVLTFAVRASVAGIDLQAVGVIMMIAGALAIALSLMLTMPRRRLSRTVVDRQGMPPAKGRYPADRGQYPAGYSGTDEDPYGYGDGRTVVEREDNI